MNPPDTHNAPAYRPAFRLQEGGLLLVIFLLTDAVNSADYRQLKPTKWS